jgi:hypothetical protein
MALIPITEIFFLARLKLPVFDKVIPKYVKLSITSSSNPYSENFKFCGNHPSVKIIKFFSAFTLSFQTEQ